MSETRPTLVVANSITDDGSVPSYSFQIAADSGFSNMVESINGIPQGANGRTSWRLSTTLELRGYFWRARANVGSTVSPFSTVADFNVRSQSDDSESPPGGRVLIFDALTNGGSIGDVQGGHFIPQGWQVTEKTDFIRYEVPPLSGGYVEWENTGLTAVNRSPENFMLFGMWDPSQGRYRSNPFRVHIQKLDTSHNPPYIRLRWIAHGEQHDEGFNFLGWIHQNVYQWRVQWGPQGESNLAEVLVDGESIIRAVYRNDYRPQVHWIELGIAERHESIVGATYRNVRIGTH